jgi:GYF domain 2
MRDEWFCSGPEGRTGPLTLDQLRAALARHPHAADVFIWNESFPDWVRVGDLGNLDQFDSPPPIPRQWNQGPYEMDTRDYRSEHHYEAPVRRRFSVLGVIVGVLLILLGCAVAYLSLTGDFNLFSELLDIDGDEINASAGAVFAAMGLVIIWATRYKISE